MWCDCSRVVLFGLVVFGLSIRDRWVCVRRPSTGRIALGCSGATTLASLAFIMHTATYACCNYWTAMIASCSPCLFTLTASTCAVLGCAVLCVCRGAPLYVGSVPGAPPAAYSALLAYKPDKPGPGAAAMVAGQMNSR